MKGIQNTSSNTYRQIMGNGIRYTVPKFQRDYSWEIDQWDDLWADIQEVLASEDDVHYLGYLVLQSTNQKNFQIIDGQQRLTTLSILILSVLDCLKKLIKEGIEADANQRRQETLRNSYIGYLDPVTLIANNKLMLNRNNESYYKQHLVILEDNLPIRNINASEKLMRACFLWFCDKVKKKYLTGEALAEFVDTLVDRLFFTVINVSDEFSAFKVFETLNSRGVQLSAADLLKNYLFSLVDADAHHSEINEMDALWSKVIEKLGSAKFPDFLRYYWNSRNKTVRKTNLFKAIRKSIQNKAEAFELVRALNNNADIFMALQDPNDTTWTDKPEIKKALKELKLFRIKQPLSLLLIAYNSLDLKDFEKLVKTCVVISFRYNIIGGLNPNEQEVTYNTLALKIANSPAQFDLKYLSDIFVNDDIFVKDFIHKSFKNTSTNHKIVKYILTKIERHLHHSDIDWESDLFTIEHILPESSSEEWGEFEPVSTERSIHRLGNLTLLERKLNQRASNLSYEEKKIIYAESTAKTTQELPLNYNSWSEDKLHARQVTLAKQAKSIWKIIP